MWKERMTGYVIFAHGSPIESANEAVRRLRRRLEACPRFTKRPFSTARRRRSRMPWRRLRNAGATRSS